MLLLGRGFTTIEVLVAIVVLATVSIAATGVAQLSSKILERSARDTNALNIARGQVGKNRLLSYDEVGLVGAGGTTPTGVLPAEETLTSDNRKYKIKNAVQFVDDPLTPETEDYKELTVTVQYDEVIPRGKVVLTSLFTPTQVTGSGSGTHPSPAPEPSALPGIPPCTPGTECLGGIECTAQGFCPNLGLICPLPFYL